MLRLATLVVIFMISVSCKSTDPPEDGTQTPKQESVAGDQREQEDGDEEAEEPDEAEETPTMTNTDPNSPEAWEQAKKIAANVAKGPFEKRSDALPFMFMAKSPPRVLVHEGEVVTDRGPAVAGRYLRDLGIIRGEGPGIEDVLYLLFALDALPPIEKVSEEISKEAYIHVPDDERLSDLTARVEYDGEQARVVLHYFLPKNDSDTEDMKENDVGAVDPTMAEPEVRPVARCTLTIPQSGDAEWTIEELNWADPMSTDH